MKWFIFLAAIFIMAMTQSQTARGAEAGRVFSYQNPLSFSYESNGAIRREVRDPAIIREGDTYYITFTMWPFANREDKRMNLPDNGSSPGIALYSTKDFKEWKFENWLVKSSELPEDSPYKHRFWAPEIHKINGKFYLIFTADNWLKKEYNPAGTWGAAGYAFVGVADKITGPYQHITYIPQGACDTTLFGDSDGTIYAVMPKYDMFIRPIDLSGLERGEVKWLGPEQKILNCKNNDIGLPTGPDYLEGPWMEKIGAKYYLFNAQIYKDKNYSAFLGYRTGVAYADHPLGPWTKDARGPILYGGHLAVFDGPDGDKWFSYRIEDQDKTRGLLAIDPLALDAKGQVQASAPTTTPQNVALKSAAVPFDLQGFIDEQIKAGNKRIVVPPGRYHVKPNKRTHLALRDLQDVQIIADNVEMICTETTRAITISNCKNLTLRGLAIDYDPLPFTQGRITALSPDKTVHEIELFDGYPAAQTAINFKYEIFKPDTRTLRCEAPGLKSVEAVDAKHLRLTKNRGSAGDPEQVGDIIAIGSANAPGGSIPHAVVTEKSANVRLENIDLWASNCFGFLEYECDGTTYQRCRIDRRPAQSDVVARADARIRSLDADAFHSKHAIKGPQIINCAAKFMGDDAVNICGNYHMVTARNGAELRVLAKDKIFAVGEPVELWSYEGVRLPDAVVIKIEPDGKINETEKAFLLKQRMDEGIRTRWNADAYKVTLDRAVELPFGSLIASTKRMGNGFLVQGCDFGFNRSRGILIKASDGKVLDNKISGSRMMAILVAPEYWWLESGSSNNVEIRGNTISDCGDVAIEVVAHAGMGQLAPSGAHRNIVIAGNSISDSPLPNIVATSTSELKIEGNTLAPSATKKLSGHALYMLKLKPETLEPVMTINCEAPILKNNKIK